MMKRFKLFTAIFLTCIMLTFVSASALANQLTLDEVANSLWAPHFCGKTLAADSGEDIEAMKAEIQQMIDNGQTKEQILDYYVGIYGEKILAEPPKKGFFLSAWIMPFVGLIAGGAIVYLFVGRRKNAVSPVQEVVANDIPDNDIDEQMKKYL